jgi:hypothetical protein
MATATETLAAAPAKQPDISYTPNHAKYLARTARRLATEDLPKTLPPDFPAHVPPPLAWHGADFASADDYAYELTTADVAELERALAHFKALGRPLGCVSAETFPLPTLGAKLRELSHEIHDGRGFALVRGLAASARSRGDAVALYAGLAAHVAPRFGRQDRTYQGAEADVLMAHIVDLSAEGRGIGSPAYTADAQVFHTDTADVVALLAIGVAERGGGSLIASVGGVYNELARVRPDLIRTLAERWPAEEYGCPFSPSID